MAEMYLDFLSDACQYADAHGHTNQWIPRLTCWHELGYNTVKGDVRGIQEFMILANVRSSLSLDLILDADLLFR